MSRTVCTVCQDHAESAFLVEGLCCQQEADVIEQRLSRVPGVERLSTDVVRQRLLVCYDAAVTSRGAIAEAVAETGMRAWPDQDRAAAPHPVSLRRQTWLLIAAAAALAAGAAARVMGAPDAWSIALMGFAVGAGGVTTVRRAIYALREGRLDMYVLMLVAVCGAALIGEWFEAATVIVLFALAQALERRSLDRVRHAISALMRMGPAKVRVRRGATETHVPVADVHVGETVVIAPGERIAFDGVVLAGLSDVNQAPVTGESLPLAKGPGDRVFAGTINGNGSLDIRASAVGDDTTLARIIHLVERAQAQRAPSHAWVDRFAHRYTPIVLALALIVAIAPPLVLAQPFQAWVYRALVLLVVACPCALVLSTPISFVSALAAAARRGVLVKGGVYLERLASIRAVALDKTGTLTHGSFVVAEVEVFPGALPEAVLSTAAAIAARSEHPLDRAVIAHARRSGAALESATGVRAWPGQGIEGTVGGELALLGSRRLFEARALITTEINERLESLAARGMAVMLVGRGGRAIGAIGLSDEVRVHGREAIAALRAERIDHVALLTGDHERNALLAAAAGEVDTVDASLLPEDKVRMVARLRDRYGPVAMVGDGLNDAPALAAADVGIAMGAAGTHVAIETADVALMADDLRAVPFAIRLGRATLATVRANVTIALGLKLVFVGLALAGVATLWMAVVADMGASLLVVANAMRLLRTQ